MVELKSVSGLNGSLQFSDSHIDIIDNKSVVSEIDDVATNKTCNDKNQTNHSNHDHHTLQQEDGFKTLIHAALNALIKSDVVCGDRTQYGSSTQGRWMFDPAAKDMQNILDRLVIRIITRLLGYFSCGMGRLSITSQLLDVSLCVFF